MRDLQQILRSARRTARQRTEHALASGTHKTQLLVFSAYLIRASTSVTMSLARLVMGVPRRCSRSSGSPGGPTAAATAPGRLQLQRRLHQHDRGTHASLTWESAGKMRGSTDSRSHFSTSASSASMQVFDRRVKSSQRRRAALQSDFASYHYLRDEVARRLVDRLADINKKFDVAVEIGCGTGAHVSKLLASIEQPADESAEQQGTVGDVTATTAEAQPTAADGSQAGGMITKTISVPERGSISTLHLCDSSPESLARTRDYWSAHAADQPHKRNHVYHVVDEEGALPFAPGSVDLIVSSMSMHWINDLPGFLRRCRACLKPDGVFLAAMLGGATLQEMRSAFTIADTERLGGVTPHVSPFVYGRDCGDLMASAGYKMPTIDTDVLTLRYPDLFTLSCHLREMGENGCGLQRPQAVSRDVFLAAAAAYESLYADDDGLLPATFQVFYLIGWAPHHSQPTPRARGSATHKLGKIDQVANETANSKPTRDAT